MQAHMPTPLGIARRYWGMSLIRGIVAIIFGLLAIFWPHLTFLLFMLIFGIFAIVEGIILFGSAFTQRTIRATSAYTRHAESAPHVHETYGTPGEVAAEEQPGYRGARREVRGERVEQPRSQRDAGSHVAYKSNRPTLIIEGILSVILGILALILPGIIGAMALYVIAAWALIKGIGSLAQTGTRGWVLGAIGILGLVLFLIILFRPLVIIHSLLRIVGFFSLIMGVLLTLRGLGHNISSRRTRPLEPSY